MATSPCLSGSARDRAEAIVGRCGGGRERKDSWMVCCPAHEDHTPSLSVTSTEDRVLLKCFAGCDTAVIVAAIAISMQDLFVDDDWQPTHKPKPPKRTLPPTGKADPVALAFAVDLVIDDVEMLTVEGLVQTLKQAATDPLQWLWLERAFVKAGMTPLVVWEVLFPGTECPYATPAKRLRRATPDMVTVQGRVIPAIQLGEGAR